MLTRLSTLIALSLGVVSPYTWAAAPLVNPLSEQSVAVGDSLVVRISGWDPDGGVPGLYFISMPLGSSFDDNGDGTRTFNWTPGIEDIGENTFVVIASDAQADGSMSASELIVNVTEFSDSGDLDDEPEIIDATETALTSVGSTGFYNFDTISDSTYFSLDIADDVDVGFGGSDNLVFGIGSNTFSVFSDSDGELLSKNDEIPNIGPRPWGSQSGLSVEGSRVAAYSGYQPVIVYEDRANAWVEESTLEFPSSADTAQRYISEVALSDQTVVTGHPSDPYLLDGTRIAGSGTVRVYEKGSSTWSNTDVIKAPNFDEHDQFGSAVAIEGDVMVVSAIGEGGAGSGSNADMFNNDFTSEFPYSHFPSMTSGAVYVYERILGSWFNTAYLKASDNTRTLTFGWDIAIDGERIYVSATGRNIDTSLNHFDYTGNLIDKNEGAVYVFEKNSSEEWAETHIIESVDLESKFGLYISAKNDALAVGSAEASSLFAYQDDQWNNLWSARVSPLSVALGNDVLAIGNYDGLRVLTAGEYLFADEDDVYDPTESTPLEAPTFYGSDFNDGVYSKTIQAGDEVSIVVSARQPGYVPGLYLENWQLGDSFEDNLDGTRTFRWQSSVMDSGVFSFDLVATNALDASVRSTASIEIVISE